MTRFSNQNQIITEIKKGKRIKTKTFTVSACYELNMFRQRKKYLLFLALFQLMVFNAPYVAKLLHHHQVSYVNVPEKGFNLTSPEKVCLICAFEFVSFVHDDPAYLPKITIEEDYPTFIHHKKLVLYFSLRAPPLA